MSHPLMSHPLMTHPLMTHRDMRVISFPKEWWRSRNKFKEGEGEEVNSDSKFFRSNNQFSVLAQTDNT